MNHLTVEPKTKKSKHNLSAPYWAIALAVLWAAGLSTIWIDLGAFWKSYVLDMAGPAWNYILFRGLFTGKASNAWTPFFTPKRTLLIFLVVGIRIESAQYFKLYEATFDPLDILAYVSILIPAFLLDLYQTKKTR